MVGAVAIARLDLTAEGLRSAASVERDGAAARRIFALALILEGADRASAARICGMDRQTLRDWAPRYNDEGLAGLRDRTGGGRSPKLSKEQRGSSPRWSRLAPIRRRTRSFAGAGLICAMRSSDALASIGMNVRLARSWPPWVTAVCPCARNIPKAIRRPRRPFKNVWPAPSARDFSRAPMISLLQRIRLRRTPSQPRWRYAHSGPHKLPGVERRFLNQAFGAPFDCQAISISPLANLIDRSAHFSALRLCPDQRLRRQGQSPDDEPFAAP
jgi:hypothetical protein